MWPQGSHGDAAAGGCRCEPAEHCMTKRSNVCADRAASPGLTPHMEPTGRSNTVCSGSSARPCSVDGVAGFAATRERGNEGAFQLQGAVLLLTTSWWTQIIQSHDAFRAAAMAGRPAVLRALILGRRLNTHRVMCLAAPLTPAQPTHSLTCYYVPRCSVYGVLCSWLH